MYRRMSFPVTDKETKVLITRNYYIASSQMQGWRPYMEDVTTNFTESPDDRDCVFLAIYDGHGGAHVANFLGTSLHTYIMRTTAYRRGDIKQAIKQGYMALDSMLSRDIMFRENRGGSTAVTVLIKDKKLYCGNAGDSVAIALDGNEVRTLSVLHKPNKKPEHQRINKAGFSVHYNRIDSDLGVSRGFGDFRYKGNPSLPATSQAVSCEPDVSEHTIGRELKFVILASDGITDVMTSKQIVTFIRKRMEEGAPPEAILELLMECCLSPIGNKGGFGSDNMSITLVVFKKNIKADYWQKTVGFKYPTNKSVRFSI